MESTEIRVEKGIQGEVGFFKGSCILGYPKSNENPNQIKSLRLAFIHNSSLDHDYSKRIIQMLTFGSEGYNIFWQNMGVHVRAPYNIPLRSGKIVNA